MSIPHSGRSRKDRDITEADIRGTLNALNKSREAAVNATSREAERRNATAVQNFLEWFEEHDIAIKDENGRYVLDK